MLDFELARTPSHCLFRPIEYSLLCRSLHVRQAPGARDGPPTKPRSLFLREWHSGYSPILRKIGELSCTVACYPQILQGSTTSAREAPMRNEWPGTCCTESARDVRL